ncbi:hypothetical protein PHAVU_007G142900 [Phaseolus vulgaris]|uniref:Alanine--tRNA ligase n=1 Tax=Phaseolus vulgaris TaxID=3885 RepID=V7BIF2_PHAVU|nr:hypothetical protein PHAVU_007G142900g [Phaseolus vulgaris]ESW16271.1 hypothetical protein PHAVU_007G142900g [Phaseolus vulgaris]
MGIPMEGLAFLPFAHSQLLLPLPKLAAISSPNNINNTNGFVFLRPHRRRCFRFRTSLFSKAQVLPLPQHQQQRQQVTVNRNCVSGDSIRQRFLHFYASRGHNLLPSASLVPDDPTVLLTIAGMLQFKPIFLGKVPRQVPCAATAQRCIRTNDIDKVGLTSRHHSFFEMLGNFSFGDYFKKQAILWAWELSTSEFGLPPDRLWVSVYEDDDEAFQLWSDEIGVPVERIKRLGEEDNFWTSGVTGPCGPCSEIYYDFHPERGYVDADLNDDTRFIEFYNLVFMQYNKKDDGSLEPLKQKNIDTGLGLERMARILQQVPNNYETDLIFPIIEEASKLANVSYGIADDQTKRNLKIIGDHMRAIVFLISDGIVPSNVGRGYVVRRLIRRVARTGRLLGIKGDSRGDLEGAFLPIIAEKVVELSTHSEADVKNKAPRIFEELKREELRFVQTLERGEKLLEEKLSDALSSAERNGTVPCMAGEDVFLLYDTYGYPMEITKEVAEEHGVSIDMDGFDIEMEKQRRQSQAAHNTVKLTIENGENIAENVPDTEFIGYDRLHCKAMIESLMVNGNPAVQVSEGSNVEVLLNKTPFYAESGGQIGDHGFLYISEGDDQPKAVVEIIDVQKSLGNIFVHKGTVQKGVVEVGKEVEAAVDMKLRQRAKVHHTATHLLQTALKKVIGQETSQAGSLVAFDCLRFDFNFHRPLHDSELAEIEVLINGWIEDATLLQTKVMPLADAKSAGAIAMFGEKYGEEVRVVEIPGVSMELCGGTHVNNTSEICGFKIISEQGIASGIRRIEAVAGEAFIENINARDFYLKQLCSTLKANFKSTLSTESLLTNEEAVIDAAASEALALAKAAVKVAKDAALLVKKKPQAEAEYRSHVSSKSDDLFLKWFQHMDVEDGVAGESMGAGAEMMEGVDLSPSEEESDVEPSHEELESLQEQLSNCIAVRSRRQPERKAKRVRAAEKASTNVASFKPGSSSRKKRVSMQEVDYSDPLRYLRTTTTTSRLLTSTEEIKLSEGIQDLLKLERIQEDLVERCGGQPTFAQWAAVAGVDQKTLRKRLSHGRFCKDKMIKSNIRLVISIAKNYQGSGMNLQDLVQEGCRGLVKGAEKFDGTKGFKFSTYAHWWIKQAVRKSLSDQSRTIRLPFHMVEATYRVKEARKQLYSENGRQPDDEEVAEAAGLSMKRLTAVLLTPKAPRSLEQKIGINQNLKPSEIISDPDAETTEEQLLKQFMKKDLQEALDSLTLRERQVVRWRFGMDDGRTKTLQQIGEMMGVSRERIRQIESSAFKKLKNKKRTKHFQQYLVP